MLVINEILLRIRDIKFYKNKMGYIVIRNGDKTFWFRSFYKIVFNYSK